MVSVISENVKKEVSFLPVRLKDEWYNIVGYYSSKSDDEIFEEFKNRWDLFKGDTIDEFLKVSNAVIKEWSYWKYKNSFYIDFGKKTLSEVWDEFKIYWQLNTKESETMFEEMELLSENMLQEWRYKYTFRYTHVYEKNNKIDFLKKKYQLWEEFKEIWEIDISKYNENKYNEMIKYIIKIECDSGDYKEDYPRNFYDFREDANYHSFDEYSILDQFEICKEWEEYR